MFPKTDIFITHYKHKIFLSNILASSLAGFEEETCKFFRLPQFRIVGEKLGSPPPDAQDEKESIHGTAISASQAAFCGADENTSRKGKNAACFDRKNYMRFCVRFDTKQQTGGSDEEPPVLDHPVIILCQIARHFCTDNDQSVPNLPPHMLSLNTPNHAPRKVIPRGCGNTPCAKSIATPVFRDVFPSDYTVIVHKRLLFIRSYSGLVLYAGVLFKRLP